MIIYKRGFKAVKYKTGKAVITNPWSFYLIFFKNKSRVKKNTGKAAKTGNTESTALETNMIFVENSEPFTQ